MTDLATTRQNEAAHPHRSTWLAANAGSGKTRVLTNRVARLLLTQVPPENILCLTYTKAAAAEMQNRLFETLGDWAMKPDEDLRAELRRLGETGALDGDRLRAARRLFASAIETPGGLKIQTIHAFCAALLRRFPLEARVSPQFRELDDRTLSILIDETCDAMAEGPQAPALDGLAVYLSGDDSLHGMVKQILSDRAGFLKPLDRSASMALFGLLPGFDADALCARVFNGDEADLLTKILPLLEAKGGNDGKAAAKLRDAAVLIPSLAALPILEDVFLTGSGAKAPFTAKIGSLPTKATQKAMDPADLDALNALMERVEDARPARLGLASAERTLALHRFAAAFLPMLDATKAEGAWLDFDDLILKARDLLSDPAEADWVLYKLDGGIDHILVDEAQDTSPLQWEVIQLLAREIGAGEGTRAPGERTLFVVGDRKQSIYSFQGADPDAMDPVKDRFAAKLADGPGLTDGILEHSFRSAPAILDAVDATFVANAGDGLGGLPTHRAFFDALPGRVDLWPVVEKEDDSDETPWYDPVDRISPRHEAARLADAVADHVKALIEGGARLKDQKGRERAVHAGDFLVLVQRRGTIFREILRAAKEKKLPVAGADRLILTSDLAVQDLLSLLSFLSLQEDDLALAEVLRSPLFGWSEADLYAVAQPRKGTLWQAVRGSDLHPETIEILHDLRNRADFLRPYDLLERILVRHGGRKRLVARLGTDCEEALDAFLGVALDYESAEVPSLTGFLEWMRAEEVEIKRQAEGAGQLMRIMTVHGAKGLEAPIVIMPDTADRNAPTTSDILMDGAGVPMWKPASDAQPPAIAEAHEDQKAKLERERQRLLYVAMTRAERWLIVCACGKAGDRSWHAQIDGGLRALGAAPRAQPTGEGLRIENGDWPDSGVPDRGEIAAAATLPGWALCEAAVPAPRPRAITPSGLGGAKALPGEGALDEEAAMRRGTLLHLLLEHLPAYPPASWDIVGRDLLRMADDRPEHDDVADLLSEATAVLTEPDLRFLFSPDALAEVDVSATLPVLSETQPLHGIIDRLVIEDSRVLAVDYKSNAVLPASAAGVPDGVLRQMGAYAAALGLIFPGKRIDTAILWTRAARLMPLPADLTDAALSRAGDGLLDVSMGAT